MPPVQSSQQGNLPGKLHERLPPLWGKLSPQVTDEGEICGGCPFPRRAGWGHPALRGDKKPSRGRGGVRPARNRMEMKNLRVGL